MKRIVFLLSIAFAGGQLWAQSEADQGNGYYLNPIFPGNYGDPSLVRVGEEYYMAFSRQNGVIIFHSRDLVSWEPLVRHRLPPGFDTVWAVDLQYFDGKFHVYMPIRSFPGKAEGAFGNFVITAEDPAGPWSAPINLDIPIPDDADYSGIDPGFLMTPEGDKYLYVNHGFAMKLNASGTKAVSTPKIVYEGWEYPDDWVVECMCLESPKLFYRAPYYYLVSAQGGTSGPSTAHMSVVARSESPLGPWQNSPHNPLTHTWHHDEPFWHQGHGTVFEATDGSWWTVYHGRVNDFPEMGRPTLLMPLTWTEDGWPVVQSGRRPWDLLPMPAGEKVAKRLSLSDDFAETELGMQWYAPNPWTSFLQVGQGQLQMMGADATERKQEIYQYAPDISFEVEVTIKGIPTGGQAGLMLGEVGISTNGSQVMFVDAPEWRARHSMYPVNPAQDLHLKIVNYRKDLSFFYSHDGHSWQKFSDGLRVDNSYRISLFARGKDGEAVFSKFVYRRLE